MNQRDIIQGLTLHRGSRAIFNDARLLELCSKYKGQAVRSRNFLIHDLNPILHSRAARPCDKFRRFSVWCRRFSFVARRIIKCTARHSDALRYMTRRFWENADGKVEKQFDGNFIAHILGINIINYHTQYTDERAKSLYSRSSRLF